MSDQRLTLTERIRAALLQDGGGVNAAAAVTSSFATAHSGERFAATASEWSDALDFLRHAELLWIAETPLRTLLHSLSDIEAPQEITTTLHNLISASAKRRPSNTFLDAQAALAAEEKKWQTQLKTKLVEILDLLEESVFSGGPSEVPAGAAMILPGAVMRFLRSALVAIFTTPAKALAFGAFDGALFALFSISLTAASGFAAVSVLLDLAANAPINTSWLPTILDWGFFLGLAPILLVVLPNWLVPRMIFTETRRVAAPSWIITPLFSVAAIFAVISLVRGEHPSVLISALTPGATPFGLTGGGFSVGALFSVWLAIWINQFYLLAAIFSERAPGITLHRLAPYVWCAGVGAATLILTLPLLAGAAVLGRNIHDQIADPDLRLHLAILAGTGVRGVAIAIAVSTLATIGFNFQTYGQKPLFGYLGFLYAALSFAVLSLIAAPFVAWAPFASLNIRALSLALDALPFVPAMILVLSLALTLRGASIVFATPMKWALAAYAHVSVAIIFGLLFRNPLLEFYNGSFAQLANALQFFVIAGFAAGLASAHGYMPKLMGTERFVDLHDFQFWLWLIGTSAVMGSAILPGLRLIAAHDAALWLGVGLALTATSIVLLALIVITNAIAPGATTGRRGSTLKPAGA